MTGDTTAEYDFFFSISAWPSIILCLMGGILVDRLVGLRLGLLIVVSSVLLGQIIWAIGGFTDKYLIMLVGRFFIGAGNELVIVIGHAFKAVWFKKDLPLAVSIDAAFGRVGGTLAILLPQLIYDSFSIFRSSNSRLGVTLTTHSCWIHESRTNLLSKSNHYGLQKRGTNIQSKKWHQVHSNTPF